MTPPKGKQRSIHMDDETFDLLQALAAKHKINNSSVVRMALAQFAASTGLNHGTVPPANWSEAIQQMNAAEQKTVDPVKSTGARDIALPDPKVSSFTVSGGKVRGKVPRNDREDDGLDV